MIKISVIVPVYKVEKYIGKCIQSLLDQTYTNFEALIVDDGSPDQSIEIAKKIVEEDPRFIFLEKENGGLSSARNYGLDRATGDYIAFLDSDDYLSLDCFSQCVVRISEDPSLDIILFGFSQVTTEGEIISQFLPNVEKYYVTQDVFLSNHSINYSVWNRLYKRDVFNGIRFIEGLLYEDKEISYKLLYNKKLYVIEKYMYFYVQASGSIMHSYNRKSIDSYLYIYAEYKNFLQSHQLYSQYQVYYEESYLRSCVFIELLHLLNYSPNFSSDVRSLEQKLDKNIFTLNKIGKYFSYRSKFFIVALMLKISPSLLQVTWRCLKKVIPNLGRTYG